MRNWAVDLKSINSLAFLYGKSLDNSAVEQSYIVVVDKQNGKVEEYPFPELSSWGTQDLYRVGNNLFLHYFYRPTEAPGVDRFYIFDVATKSFKPLVVDTNIFKVKHLQVYAASNPLNESQFAIAFCNNNSFLGECSNYGIALSDSQSLVKLFDIRYPYLMGWKDGKFFVNKNDSVYLVDPAKVE